MFMKKHSSDWLGVFEYSEDDWIIGEKDNSPYLRYKGNGKDVRLPEGCINCRYMFYNSRRKLNLSKFDTTGVVDMSHMFQSYGYKELDLSNFDTESVINMNSMFNNAKVESLDLSCFDTRNVLNMLNMFSKCEKLRRIDISSFDMSSVIVCSGMFEDCIRLRAIDMSNLQFNKTGMQLLFTGCINLKAISLPKITEVAANSSRSAFLYCNRLKFFESNGFYYNNDMHLVSKESMLKEV